MAKGPTKIDVIDRDLTILVPEMAPERMNKVFHQYAREERDKARAHNKTVLGYDPDYDTRVNGSPSAIERATVKDVIQIEFELATTMYQWINDMLILNSPVGQASDPRPGHPELYAKSHVFFVDGNLADPEGPVPQHNRAVFLNLQPYARKIERGLSKQTPEGVYRVVADMARRKFGNFAKVKFGYETPHNFGAIDAWAATTNMISKGRANEKREEWLRRQPAIIIDL